jgi:hypothetical protein
MVQWSRRSHKAYSLGRPIVLLSGALAAAAAAPHCTYANERDLGSNPSVPIIFWQFFCLASCGL